MCGWLHFPALRSEGLQTDRGQARAVASKAIPSWPVLTAGNLACWPFSCSAAGEGVWSWPLTPQLVLSLPKGINFLSQFCANHTTLQESDYKQEKHQMRGMTCFYQQNGLWTRYIHRQTHMCLMEFRNVRNFEVTACFTLKLKPFFGIFHESVWIC